MPHSIYSKMFDVLTVLSEKNPIDILVLSNDIHNRGIESFAIWRKEKGANLSEKRYCSPLAIQRLIKFIGSLELINIDQSKRTCEMAATGSNALIGENFPVQLGAQLVRYLKENMGISLEDLEIIIRSITLPEVPDNTTIYLNAMMRPNTHGTDEEFRRILYLLQRCGKLTASVRKIYKIPQE